MSSTPVTPKPTTPAPQPVTISSVFAKDWSWLVSHIIALLVVGGLVVASVYGVENLIAKHDASISAKDQALLQTVVDQNKALITEAQTKDALLQQTIVALSAANAQLGAQQKVRDTQLAVQEKANATLSAQQAADRLTQQTKASAGEITATGNTVSLDLPMSRQFVTDLDMLPVAQADLADTQKQLANETAIANAALADIAAQKAIVAGLNAQIVDINKADAAEIKALKSSARKGKLKWFGIGFVVGFVSGVTAHSW